MPAACARASPAASARLAITTAISARSRPSAMASISACRLLPRPEMSTPIRRPRSDPTPGPPSPVRGLTPIARSAVRGEAGNSIALAIRAMTRPRRLTPGGCVYHVCNRGSRRDVILETYEDYAAFCALVEEARRKRPMRILAYSLRRTHFHFLLWPVGDQDVPRFMKWLTATHAARFHRSRDSVGTGAVYQSRYVSRGIEDVRDFISILRYIEANALKDRVVTRAE